MTGHWKNGSEWKGNQLQVFQMCGRAWSKAFPLIGNWVPWKLVEVTESELVRIHGLGAMGISKCLNLC